MSIIMAYLFQFPQKFFGEKSFMFNILRTKFKESNSFWTAISSSMRRVQDTIFDAIFSPATFCSYKPAYKPEVLLVSEGWKNYTRYKMIN